MSEVNSIPCNSCANFLSEVQFLRNMVKELTDKLMAVSGTASDRYYQLKLAEATNSPKQVHQIAVGVPEDQSAQETDFLNSQMEQWMNQAKMEMNV